MIFAIGLWLTAIFMGINSHGLGMDDIPWKDRGWKDIRSYVVLGWVLGIMLMIISISIFAWKHLP